MHIHLAKSAAGWRDFNAMRPRSERQLLATTGSSKLPLRPVTTGQRDFTFDAAVKQILQALEERYGRCVLAQPK